MTSRRVSTQLLQGREWSKHLRWTVTLQCDHRGNVTQAEALATYGYGENALAGHAHVQVGPFDTLPDVLQVLMVDAASNCAEQLTLFRS